MNDPMSFRFLRWLGLVIIIGLLLTAAFYAWVKFIKFCVSLPW